MEAHEPALEVRLGTALRRGLLLGPPGYEPAT